MKRKRHKKIRKKNFQFFPIPYHKILFTYLLENNEKILLKLREEPTKSIINSILLFLKPSNDYSIIDDISFIELIQKKLEDEINKIVSKKGIYYWFHLYRRFAPGSNFNNESATTIGLYRQMTECSFLKYGSIKSGKELLVVDKENEVNITEIGSGFYKKALEKFNIPVFPNEICYEGVYLGEFDFNDLVESCQLERLIYEYWHTTTCLRRLYKGGILRIQNNDYFVENNETTKKLINLYDERAAFGGFASTLGVLLFPKNLSFKKGMSFLPDYNIKNLSLKEYPIHKYFHIKVPLEKEKEFIPNFVWAPFDFDYFYCQNRFLEKEFEKEFGFSLACFCYTLFLVCQYAYVSSILNKGIKGYQLIQRAYQHFSCLDEYINWLIDISKSSKLPSLGQYVLNKKELYDVLDKLSFKDKKRGDINLTTRGPRSLIIPFKDNQFIIDYVSVLHILSSQMHFIKNNNPEKGHIFEDAVIDRLNKKGFNLWLCKKEMNHPDGSSKEIDVSFYIKNVLFICEMKCINKSFAFDIGDIEALDFRKKKLIKALTESEDKVNWLLAHKNGNNYNVPNYIDAFVPLVITPFVEYIWAIDDYLWLTEKIPRICTPFELEQLLADDSLLSDLIAKPFVRFLV